MKWTLTRKLNSARKNKYYIATWIKIEMLLLHAFVRGMRCLFYLNFEIISFEFLNRWLRNGLQHCETGKIACDTPFYQSIRVIISMQMSIGAEKL